MPNFLLLLKMRFKELLGIKPWKTVLMQLLFSAAGLALSLCVSLLIAGRGFQELLPLLGYVIGVFVSFIVTVLKINDSLSGRGDTEQLLALPIPVFGHVLALFLLLYLNSFVYILVLTAPMGLVYGISVGAPTGFWALWIFALLLTGLPAVGIASLAGTFIALCLASSRKRNLIQSILSLTMLAALTLIAIIIIDAIANTLSLGTALDSETLCRQLIDTITLNFRFGRLYQSAVIDRSGVWLLLFAALSLIWNLFFVFFLTMGYQVIMLSLKSPVEYKKYRWHRLEERSQKTALLHREIDTWLHSKLYMLRSMAIHIIALLLGAYLAIKGCRSLMEAFGIAAFYERAAYSVPLLVCLIAGASVISYCSYAAEGRTHWIAETVPVDREQLYKCKLKTNLLIHGPLLSLECLLFSLAFRESALYILPVSLVAAWLYLWLISAHGLKVSRRYAEYTGQTEQEILGQRAGLMRGFVPQLVLPILLLFVLWMVISAALA